jgi:hypothetical protein
MAVGNVLAAFQWDSGASTWGDGKTWTKDLPSDAHASILLLECR